MRFPKCPRYLVLFNKSYQNFMAYLKPVIQFDHESARVWEGLTELSAQCCILKGWLAR